MGFEVVPKDDWLFATNHNKNLPAPFQNQVYLLECHLAGTTHIEGIAEKTKGLNVGSRVKLQRDPKNEHDKQAIGVFIEKDVRIGWVPQHDNEVISRLMDAGKFLYGQVEEIGSVTKTGYLELYFKVYLCDI